MHIIGATVLLTGLFILYFSLEKDFNLFAT